MSNQTELEQKQVKKEELLADKTVSTDPECLFERHIDILKTKIRNMVFMIPRRQICIPEQLLKNSIYHYQQRKYG